MQSKKNLASRLEDLVDSIPELKDPLCKYIRSLLNEKTAKRCVLPAIAKKIGVFFQLDKEYLQICSFAYILHTYTKVYDYFVRTLELDEYENQHLLAIAMGISHSKYFEYVAQLASMGILEKNTYPVYLVDSILDVWRSGTKKEFEELFCGSLPEPAISFKLCNVENSAKKHVIKLLKLEDDEPKHIFLYGPPGTGKTTFAACLAKELGVKAWSVVSKDDDSVSDRRCSLMACIRMAEKTKGSFVLVDEAENILDTEQFSLGRSTGGSGSSKAWLTPFLERKGIRIIWISNFVEHIDHAVRRRFTFSIYFPNLSDRDRQRMWRSTAQRLNCSKKLSRKTIERLSSEYPVEAAMIEKALRQSLCLAGPGDFIPTIERILTAHLTLENNGHQYKKHTCRPKESFTLKGLTTKDPVENLLKRLRRLDTKMRLGTLTGACNATLLFYGPPGTGKTELARYIAKVLDRPCHVKTASSLLSSYVGETESNIAEAFEIAQREEAVLVFDEADSFLANREGAHHSWERTQTNEFLTQLENCRTFCICTCNFRKILDSAAMRRFTFKTQFLYAGPKQIESLYNSILSPLAKEEIPSDLLSELKREKMLTPGDFRSVYAQFSLDEETVMHTELISALKHEEKLKLENNIRGIGFTTA